MDPGSRKKVSQKKSRIVLEKYNQIYSKKKKKRRRLFLTPFIEFVKFYIEFYSIVLNDYFVQYKKTTITSDETKNENPSNSSSNYNQRIKNEGIAVIIFNAILVPLCLIIVNAVRSGNQNFSQEKGLSN